MDFAPAALVTAAVVALGVLIGVVSRTGSGRRPSRGTVVLTPRELGAEVLGERATLVQFSTEFCSRCPATRRLLGEIAAARPGVVHLDVDLTRRADLADRFRVLQTPTTLVVRPDGTVAERIGGLPRRGDVERALAVAAAAPAEAVRRG